MRLFFFFVACRTFFLTSANWLKTIPKLAASTTLTDEKTASVEPLSDAGYVPLRDLALKAFKKVTKKTLRDSVELKFGDHIIGVRNVLNNLIDGRQDLSSLRSLFIKSSYETPFKYEGEVSVILGYEPVSNILSIDSEWINKKESFLLNFSWNNKNRITELGASFLANIREMEYVISSKFKPFENKVESKLRISGDVSAMQLDYDDIEKDPILRVLYKNDDYNLIEPSMSLKTGVMTYTYTRLSNATSSRQMKYQPEKNLVSFIDIARASNMDYTLEFDVSTKDFSASKFKYSPVYKF